ncbi:PREDICTED: PHD finger protein 21B-like, partial [Dipodomys ordii]|uniref:PHD finger protein 21B-like n=1 Tax=Dipodomys ordii TaxID=10020 RepID=A0A1S3GV20_DIPOR
MHAAPGGPGQGRHRSLEPRAAQPRRKGVLFVPLPSPGCAASAEPLPPSFQTESTHEEHCAACKRGANLQPCGTCSGAYHLSCLDPPLKAAPKGVWLCPKCQQKALKRDEGVPWTGMLAIVHSYVTHKT